MKKSWARLIPVAVPVAVVAAAITIPASAGASVSLPEKSAQQVLESISDSSGLEFSGQITQTSDLGLPEIPSTGAASGASGGAADASSALELLTGSHDARVYVGGPGQLRVQVLDSLAERDVVRNGSDVWLYDSDSAEATHLTLPSGSADDVATPGATATPGDIAAQFLANIDPTTTVTVGENARVAGRTVYKLVLTPKASDTLVGSVSISVDSETGLPLGVEVEARGRQDPAFSSVFTSIDVSTPSADLFDFTPPASATVTEQTLPEKATNAPSDAPLHDSLPADAPQPTVIGTGWSTIVELPAGTLTEGAAAGPEVGSSTDSTDGTDATALLEQLTTEVDGGRVLQTALVSVFIGDDGRVLVGSVDAAQLQAAAVRGE